jgi:hypothetical protein
MVFHYVIWAIRFCNNKLASLVMVSILLTNRHILEKLENFCITYFCNRNNMAMDMEFSRNEELLKLKITFAYDKI